MDSTIVNFAFGIGTVIMCLGAVLLASSIILFLGWLVQFAWTAFSVTFRAICKTESLICDYKKNREKFLEWREGEENMRKGRMEDLYGK
jgi:hypothetical protein